ncbi:MAG TPA: fumarylacetoacetate hydrolase family protein [Kangiella sp.]
MKTIIDPAAIPMIPVINVIDSDSDEGFSTGSEPIYDSQFPVRRIYCVGRNYAAHAREMGDDGREAPFFFSKPADSIVVNPKKLPYPRMTNDLHHEVELVVAIGEPADSVSVEQAEHCILGYALGIDLTKRDLQAEAKSKGRPWDLAKGFDQSAPISSIILKEELGLVTSGKISLSVDNDIRQSADISDMVWSIPEVISELSKHIALQPGDLIFTGTPEGVGPIQKGQLVQAEMLNRLKLAFTVI